MRKSERVGYKGSGTDYPYCPFPPYFYAILRWHRPNELKTDYNKCLLSSWYSEHVLVYLLFQ